MLFQQSTVDNVVVLLCSFSEAIAALQLVKQSKHEHLILRNLLPCISMGVVKSYEQRLS